jgi:hypothetical protein
MGGLARRYRRASHKLGEALLGAGELVRRAELEPVESVTDVVRRDCITLFRKPEAA